MDEIFEHFHKVFEDMTFSGFFTPKFRNQSPRDEMLRRPENESDYLQVPEPWIPFPFYGDLVKPDMMDRKMFSETLEVKELQKRVVREPDGTEVHTTIERSCDGEKKHVIYMRPDGQQSQTANSEDLLIMDPSPSMKEYQSENKSSGIFDALRRWYYGN
ncbi:unnamed protein product [Schistosoma curassoni]|nr:unnamed protein product [Schistosoma curassoni]